ncbi:momilactone A synthase-like [Triticum dicoccoides]|uniref:momilactone A synthase-like n=1 Tax=Triticum dicoccoides TaxID=85692 RepID=UPI001890C0A5|nr:momilactone A synthase-like [Triticum dicoccoides]
MFLLMRVLFSTAKSGAAGRAGSPSRPLSASSDSRRLAGKVAVITGAASGIGKVTAAEFVRNGAKVVLADVQDSLGRAVAAELGDPDTACYTRCDVTDEGQVAAAVDLAVFECTTIALALAIKGKDKEEVVAARLRQPGSGQSGLPRP